MCYWSWRESWVNDGERGEHGRPNSRATTFRCEARAKYQRWRNDSENWEPSRSTCSSTRSTTESIIQSFQSRMKTNDSRCGIELCEMLETQPKTQCTVCSSYWNIGIHDCTCGHLLPQERGANQEFISFTMDLLFSPWVCQEGKTSWTSIWWKAGRQIILRG